MRAARGGHTEVVVELVKAQANLDIQDKVRLTQFMMSDNNYVISYYR